LRKSFYRNFRNFVTSCIAMKKCVEGRRKKSPKKSRMKLLIGNFIGKPSFPSIYFFETKIIIQKVFHISFSSFKLREVWWKIFCLYCSCYTFHSKCFLLVRKRKMGLLYVFLGFSPRTKLCFSNFHPVYFGWKINLLD